MKVCQCLARLRPSSCSLQAPCSKPPLHWAWHSFPGGHGGHSKTELAKLKNCHLWKLSRAGSSPAMATKMPLLTVDREHSTVLPLQEHSQHQWPELPQQWEERRPADACVTCTCQCLAHILAIACSACNSLFWPHMWTMWWQSKIWCHMLLVTISMRSTKPVQFAKSHGWPVSKKLDHITLMAFPTESHIWRQWPLNLFPKKNQHPWVAMPGGLL